MKLISCDSCGVILDAEKLKFPSSGYTEEGIDDSCAAYDQQIGEFRVYVPCPVCKHPVFGDKA